MSATNNWNSHESYKKCIVKAIKTTVITIFDSIVVCNGEISARFNITKSSYTKSSYASTFKAIMFDYILIIQRLIQMNLSLQAKRSVSASCSMIKHIDRGMEMNS